MGFVAWVMARFSNMQLLQASGAFVAYTMLTWMIFDYACLNRLKMKQWITILLIGMTIVPILDIGIGIRYANAFIIAGYAFYRHYIKNVGIIRTIGVLLAAIFLHHAIIPIIVAWVALPFFSKHKEYVRLQQWRYYLYSRGMCKQFALDQQTPL